MVCHFVVCAPPDPPPVITSSPVYDVNENRMLAMVLTADEAVTWSIDGGEDMAQFEIVNGILRWIANGTRDYELPADRDFNNVYKIIIRATDAGNNSALQTVSVTVNDVDDTDPMITSPNAQSVPENTALTHQMTASEPVTWTIVSGADASLFELSGSVLRFLGNATKDYETPDDSNLDNDYVVTLRATDPSNNYNQQTVTITVTDVSEIKWATFKDGDNTGVVLSDLDVGIAPTPTGNGYGLGVASTAWKNHGKHYFEVTRLNNGWWVDRAGLAIEGFAYDNLVYGTAQGFGIPVNSVGLVEWMGGSVRVWGEYGQLMDLGDWAVGEVVCFATDLDNFRFWVRRGANGPWLNGWGVDPPVLSDPATNLNGIDISYVSQTRVTFTAAFTGWNTGKFLFNTGDSPFVGAVPAGFTPGWATGSHTAKGHPTYAYWYKLEYPVDYDMIEKGDLLYMRLMGSTATPRPYVRIAQNDFKADQSGKFYYEIHPVQVSSTADFYGLMAHDAGASPFTSGIYWTYNYFNEGAIFLNGTHTGLTLGDVGAGRLVWVGVALDRINRKVWFRRNNGLWNNQPTANPATNTGGIDISSLNGKRLGPAAGTGNTFDGTRVILNAGGSPFVYPVPAGFTAGWPRNPADTTPPTITAPTTFNNAEDTVLSITLTANEYVRWSISGGADATRFDILGNTVLCWLGNGTKDYQAPDDANTDNIYIVTVRATDESGNFSSQNISVTVYDPNPPVLTGPPTTYDNMEGTKLALDLIANEPVAWTISGGADAAKFEISGTTLRWLGDGTKTFAAPDDADHNNTYVVTVRATDLSGNITNRTVTVAVLNSAILATTPLLSSTRADLNSSFVSGDGTKTHIIPGIGAVT